MSHASIIVALESDKDIESQIEHQMLPFDENGEWFRDGSRWDWYQIGGRYSGKLLGKDIVKRSELTDEAIEDFNIAEARKLWTAFEKETRKNDEFIRSYMYGLEDNDTLETVIARYKKSKITAFAFLQDRHWHENDRLGWFGGTTPTECEIKDGYKGICIQKDEKLGARIINYKNPKWNEFYFDRFIRDLPPETILVNVDFHV